MVDTSSAGDNSRQFETNSTSVIMAASPDTIQRSFCDVRGVGHFVKPRVVASQHPGEDNKFQVHLYYDDECSDSAEDLNDEHHISAYSVEVSLLSVHRASRRI